MDKVYITKSGDMWDMIAKEVYGDELYASYLMSNNQDKLDYYQFPQGIRLTIKELTTKEKVAETLPGWRS